MNDSQAQRVRAMRYAAGKALRKAVPREAHASWVPAADRDPLAILALGDVGRVQALVHRRYALMRPTAYTFLRGAAAIMAADLVGAPMAGIPVQACGDCHIGNFGTYLSPEGRVMFDINDFDETLPGVDFTVDLKRLAASIAVEAIAEESCDDETARRTACLSVRAYREHMHDLAQQEPLAAWRSVIDLDHELSRIDDVALRERLLRGLDEGLSEEAAKADLPRLDPGPGDGAAKSGAKKAAATKTEDKKTAASKLAPPKSWRIADESDRIFHKVPRGSREPVRDAQAALLLYPPSLAPERRCLVARYALRDVAFKVVGVGSVGRVCAIGLYADADGALLVLQIKQAVASVIAPLALVDPEPGKHEGERVVDGQRIMQGASDIFLGTAVSPASGRDYYVRQLKNKKLSKVAELMSDGGRKRYARLCGTTLARAHARSGDAATLAGYMGKSEVFDEAIADFAMSYVEQTTDDHARLCALRGDKA